MSSGPVVGIDLGTTNSCVAVLCDGTPVVIPNKGELTTPSVVAITAAGKLLVGREAKRQAVTNAEHTVHAQKRLIGRQWSAPETRRTARGASYALLPGPHEDVRVELRGRAFSLPELSALILQQLKLAAETHLGVPVDRAVVTVPAYFNDHQRQATRDAGAIAGLDVLRIINEPTAAALAFGFGRRVDKCIAIYDLGGGTFDISVVRVRGADCEVLATGGDSFLGGEDFDERVVDALIEGFAVEHGIDLRADRTALQRLKESAEGVKRALSTALEAEVDLPLVATRASGEGLHLRRTFARQAFEELTKDLVERTLVCCEEVLGEAGLAPSAIDEVVLVGGMSRMPRIDAAVRSFFRRAPSSAVHPDEAVALGAAIHAAALGTAAASGATPGVRLRDVTSQAIGLMDAYERFDELIAKNTPVPASRTELFTTSYDDQEHMQFVVLQGGRPRAADNERLGELALEGLRRGRAGEHAVEVTFTVDEEGIVKVSARDRDTGREQSLRVVAKSGLTREEVRAMAEASGRRATETRRNDDEAALFQKAEKLAYDVERLVGSLRDKLRRDPLVIEAVSLVQMLRAALQARDGADVTMTLMTLDNLRPELEALVRR
ncbi:MAG: Hsp70 family protein [Polyangiaceae bacterium]|nr:Hsp70 family protein [Polyangiaceae bacterium]